MARKTNIQPRATGAGVGAFRASLDLLNKTPVRQRRPAASAANDIAKAADRLARMMRDLHGGAWGQWSTHIDHSTGFILIRPVKARKGGEA